MKKIFYSILLIMVFLISCTPTKHTTKYYTSDDYIRKSNVQSIDTTQTYYDEYTNSDNYSPYMNLNISIDPVYPSYWSPYYSFNSYPYFYSYSYYPQYFYGYYPPYYYYGYRWGSPYWNNWGWNHNWNHNWSWNHDHKWHPRDGNGHGINPRGNGINPPHRPPNPPKNNNQKYQNPRSYSSPQYRQSKDSREYNRIQPIQQPNRINYKQNQQKQNHNNYTPPNHTPRNSTPSRSAPSRSSAPVKSGGGRHK